MSSDLPFLRAFMTEIGRLHRLPKVQVERIVGPLLGMFLPDAIAPCLSRLGANSGYRLVAPEFPLADATTNRSTNIDWLLVHPERGLVVFLELKTDRGSMDGDQVDIYTQLCARIANDAAGASFLVDDLARIEAASTSRKYGVLRDEVAPFESMLRGARAAHTVWLVPRGTRTPSDAHVVYFADLPATVAGPYAEAWTVVREGLVALEESTLHAPSAITRDVEITPDAIAQHIRANLRRNGETARPRQFWFGIAARERPNYQVEFANGEVRTYHYGGNPFQRADRFDQTKLSGPHLFED